MQRMWRRVAAATMLLAAGFTAGMTIGRAEVPPAPRFARMTLEQTSGAQRALAERMVKETRAGLGGPWNVLVRSPEVGVGILDLYNYYRHRAPLGQRLVEFGILVTAREWSSNYEWFIHYPIGVAQGLAPEMLADLRLGRRPAAMKPDEAIVYDFAIELLRTHGVSDATFARAKAQFGEQGVVDLTTLVGTYVSVAGVLSVGGVTGTATDGPTFLPPL